jgi:DMSO/TMAO reductase YedYZ heme-binding membrane subunit
VTILDLCAYLGLGAAGGATLNLWLGLLLAMRYSPLRLWPHRHINIFALHQRTAYATVTLALAHPVVLLWLHAPHFRIIDLIWPLNSPLQPWINIAGAVALYLLVLLLTTSLLRLRIGRPVWRRLHYLAFPAVVMVFVHSILTDPLLKNGHPDLLDGGKIFVEVCGLLSTAAIVARMILRRTGFRPRTGEQTMQA